MVAIMASFTRGDSRTVLADGTARDSSLTPRFHVSRIRADEQNQKTTANQEKPSNCNGPARPPSNPQDSNTRHLSEVLKRAAAHRGTAFVEVYQSCVVFNPQAWDHITDPNVREDNILFLEDGQPLVFGKDRDKGIRMEEFSREVVQLGHGLTEDDLLVHREGLENSSYAYMLSRMEYPEFPQAFGVLRAVERPTYEDMLGAQEETALQKAGPGELAALYHSSDTWEVK